MDRSAAPQKILMATDYSDPSFNAACYALQYAYDTNSTLVLLHVYPSVTAAEMAFYEPEWQKDRVRYEEWKVRDHAQQVCDEIKIEINSLRLEYLVADGNPAKAILEVTKREKADLLILGTHGTGNIKETFMGSQTWDVMKKASVPVLAIPPHFKYRPVKNIVFAVQGDAHEEQAIEQFSKTFASANMRFYLLHVTDVPGHPVVEEQYFHQFSNRIKEKLGTKQVEPAFRYSDKLMNGLNTFCTENNADWLIMSPEKLNPIERFLYSLSSATRGMAFHTQFPLLMINTAVLDALSQREQVEQPHTTDKK